MFLQRVHDRLPEQGFRPATQHGHQGGHSRMAPVEPLAQSRPLGPECRIEVPFFGLRLPEAGFA